MPENIRDNLERHLKQIIRERDPYFATAGHFYTKEYIRQELGKFGPVETHQFEAGGETHENLILDLTAGNSGEQKPPIIIGAHYDTVPGSPGADDNGTGVAVLLELAKFFSHNLGRYPIRLVAFDMEEYGLLGSTAYAEMLNQEKQPIRLMLSLEMLGYCDRSPNSQLYPPGLKYFYPSEGNFIALIGNILTIPDLITISRHIRQANILCEWLPAGLRGLVVPATRRSDHAPFWDRGYKAIMVTDTADLRNPNYHSPRDTLETIDLDFLTGVFQGLSIALSSRTF